MDKEHAIKLFQDKRVRVVWDEEQEKWYFSIVDVVGVLSDSENPQVYWRVLKKRLLDEGNETVTNCNALKMKAEDGKIRLTDVADTEQLLRLIQSIPSPRSCCYKKEHVNRGFAKIVISECIKRGISRGGKEISISAWEEKTRKIYSSFGKSHILKKVNYKKSVS